MRVEFPDKISNYKIYTQILPQLSEYYMKGGEVNPILSFVNTEWIEYESIPLIMGILEIIYDVNDESIGLDLVYRPHFLYCLEHSKFFYYAGVKLGYIDYQRELIGGFSDYDIKQYEKKHVMHVYYPFDNYFSYPEEEQENIRLREAEIMRYHYIPAQFGDVINTTGLCEKDVEDFKTILAELITNARLYSGSLCYALFYSNKYKTKISICDVGQGLKNSLDYRKYSSSYADEKIKEFKELKDCYRKEYSVYDLNDFFLILESLFYSELQDRINLRYLKNMITQNNGVLRIHTGMTQVIFSSRVCKDCDKDIKQCVGCLLNRMSLDTQTSCVRCFNSKLKGVHIEIEFDR